MIDHYIWGGATRLSPEAPVPIVNVKTETTTLGGAGNLTKNLVSLGAKVMVGGIIGDDAAEKELIGILTNEGVSTNTIITDTGRSTTVKTRVLAGNQQMSTDRQEQTNALSPQLEDELLGKISACISGAIIVLLSDYNKGLFSPSLTSNHIRR